MISRISVEHFIVRYLLPLGLIVQMTGIHWLGKGGSISQTYIWLLLPAIIIFFMNSSALKHWRPDLQELFLIGFCFIAMLSWLWSDTDKEFSYLFKRTLYVVVYLYSVYLLSQYLEKLKHIMLIAGLIAAAGATIALINQVLLPGRDISYRSMRLFSIGYKEFGDFGNPIPAGIYFGAIGTLLFSGLCLDQLSRYKTPILIIALAPVLLYLFMTGSRGPQLALVVAFALTCLLVRNKQTNVFLSFGLVSSVAIGWMFHDFFLNMASDSTLSGRAMIWEQVIGYIQQKPMMGHGYDASMAAVFHGREFLYSHNYYLQSLYCYGAIGFFFFSGLIITTFIAAYKHWQDRLVKMAFFLLCYGLVCMMTEVHRLFINPDENWLIFWLPVAIILGRKRHIEYTQQETINV